MGLLLVKQRFGGADVGQADRRELGLRVELGLAQLLLDLGAAPKAAVDLLAGKLFLRLQVAGGRALAAGEDGDEDADDDEADADRQEEDRVLGDQGGCRREADPDDDEDDRHGDRRLPRGLQRRDLVVDLDLAFEAGPQLAHLAVEGPQAADDLAEDRQRVRRGVGRREDGDLLAHGDRRPVPLESFLGGGLLGGEALRLASLLEEGPALHEGGLDHGAPLARARQRVAIALEEGEGGFALFDRPG